MKDGIKEKRGAGPGRGGRELSLLKRWRREGRTELEVDNKLLLEGKSHQKPGRRFLCSLPFLQKEG